MAFEYAQFVNRNPMYAMKNWRAQSSVRKAMLEYRTSHPECAWCGRTKKLDVHHIVPVSVAPLEAGNKANMITLCRKPQCHLIVGHDGNYAKRYTHNVEEVCRRNKTTLISD